MVWRYKRAVKKANELHELFHMKYLVLYINGSFKVIPKQNVKRLIRQRFFKKGTKIEDVCRMAAYSTI